MATTEAKTTAWALLLLQLLSMTSAAAVGPLNSDSAALPELLGRADKTAKLPGPPPVSAGASRPPIVHRPDPYDEFAEPRSLDWPPKPETSQGDAAERLRRRILWQIARHPDLARRQRRLERLGPMKPHARDGRLDQLDPYSEFASAAYYRFVRAILDMRNRMTELSGFDESSAIRELFEETPPSKNGNSTTTPSPPTVPPSPPVLVCPPRWRLGDHGCKRNATFCFKDAECHGSRCCFDGCKLRCLEPELLVKHVCKDYMNSSAFPGDLYMRHRTQICTCDELGRPVGCKDKKPCIDIISSSLFKLPYINSKTAKLKKRERTTRQKIYDALQEAFKHVNKVY